MKCKLSNIAYKAERAILQTLQNDNLRVFNVKLFYIKSDNRNHHEVMYFSRK